MVRNATSQVPYALVFSGAGVMSCDLASIANERAAPPATADAHVARGTVRYSDHSGHHWAEIICVVGSQISSFHSGGDYF